MDSFIRGIVIFVFLLILMRLSGKRTFSQNNVFNAILLIIISESISPAFEADDHSITDSLMISATLIFMNITISYIKQYWPGFENILDNLPLILIEKGKLNERRMNKSRIDLADILSSARETQGIEHVNQIKYAVLERDGKLSIIPTEEAKK
jgi:uncharacterized membrane protein YcaP (DUF421 family)